MLIGKPQFLTLLVALPQGLVSSFPLTTQRGSRAASVGGCGSMDSGRAGWHLPAVPHCELPRLTWAQGPDMTRPGLCNALQVVVWLQFYPATYEIQTKAKDLPMSLCLIHEGLGEHDRGRSTVSSSVRIAFHNAMLSILLLCINRTSGPSCSFQPFSRSNS